MIYLGMPRYPKDYDGKTPLKKPQHENFVRQVVKSGSQVDAYRQQYPRPKAPSTERTNACLLMKKPHIKKRFTALMDEAGLSDTQLATNLNALTNSNDKLTHEGKLSGDEKPALAIRLEATKTALKLKGYLKPNSPHFGDNIAVDARSVQYSINNKDISALTSIVHSMHTLTSHITNQDGEVHKDE